MFVDIMCHCIILKTLYFYFMITNIYYIDAKILTSSFFSKSHNYYEARYINEQTDYAQRYVVRRSTKLVENYNGNNRIVSTQLSMNLLTRFVRVAKSNLNNILKILEDPVKVMNQAIEDMQSDLVRIRQSYAELTAMHRRLHKQKEYTDKLITDWYNKAQLALRKGNEELAREALTRRQKQMEISNNLQEQINTHNISLDKLYEGMKSLETKIVESKGKQQQIVARTCAAQSTIKVNDMLNGISDNTSVGAFDRMEKKVEALEAAAEVSAELKVLTGTKNNENLISGSIESGLQKEFAILEGANDVDTELSKLKGLLLSGNSYVEPDTKSIKPLTRVFTDDEFIKSHENASGLEVI